VLLTVSKNAKEGGQYRSLKAALAEAKPWGTVRVLDDATYTETIVLDQPARHRGIVLEAAKGATIAVPGLSNQGLVIENVPYVRVKGFRLQSPRIYRYLRFITVSSHCPGTVLTGLNIRVNTPVSRAILLQNVRVSAAEHPVVVRGCAIQVMGDSQCDGITVTGPGGGEDATTPSGGIAIRENRIAMAVRGILIQGKVSHTHVTGNLLWKCQQSALQIEDLQPGSRHILVANNTAFDNHFGFRVWDNPPFQKHEPGQVEVRNNLLIHNEVGDMGFILGQGGGGGSPGDGRPLIRMWRFGNNWRDFLGEASFSMPRAPGDRRLKDIILPSDPRKPDFMRPAAKSTIASGGAGKEDPSLPRYVGAVPPEGARTWDWGRTWKDRAKRAGPLARKGAEKGPAKD
jgi:hypothetical protein